MDSELLARMSPAHQRRLAWFEEHQGEVSGIPGELADGLLLVSKPKGIYKPNDLPYALSIRINLDSPYADGMEVPTPGGGWLLRYHQERANPSDRDTMFTNRGLMRCIADRIPVGVLRERAPAGRSSRYDVLGLAMPVRWSDGYFFFESLSPRATPVIDPVSDVLEATARAEVDEQAVGSSPLEDAYDARLRMYRQIVARRGQSAFRAALLDAYQNRCAITGWTQSQHWKAPTSARTGDRTQMSLPTGCCYEPIYIRCSISSSWPLPLGPGALWSLSCSPGRNTRRFRLAISPIQPQSGSARATRPWRSFGNTSAKPKTTGKKKIE